MPFTELDQVIKSFINISLEELHGFHEYCTINSYKKKDYIIKRNNMLGKLFYVNHGICYSQKPTQHGEYSVMSFYQAGDLIVDARPFYNGSFAEIDVIALNDSELIEIPKQAIDFLSKEVVEAEKFARQLNEYFFLAQYRKLMELRTLSLAERVTAFHKKYLGVVDSMSQQKLASYLGISPEHLSKSHRKGRLTW
jgi:CRP-like cAMP-binding protein